MQFILAFYEALHALRWVIAVVVVMTICACAVLACIEAGEDDSND